MLVTDTKTVANAPGTVVGTDLCKGAGRVLRVDSGKQERISVLQPRNEIAMADPNVLNPNPPEFDRFLHASVGEDRNGYGVTVLSALARLGLDPWKETAELVALGRDAAQARLGTLLARIRDVPELANHHVRVARDLSRLLPDRPASVSFKRAAATVTDGRLGRTGAIWALLAIVLVLFKMVMPGGTGSGE